MEAGEVRLDSLEPGASFELCLFTTGTRIRATMVRVNAGSVSVALGRQREFTVTDRSTGEKKVVRTDYQDIEHWCLSTAVRPVPKDESFEQVGQIKLWKEQP